MSTQPYLDKLTAQYRKVAAEIADKKADLEIANQDEVRKLEKKLEEMKTKMGELQNATEDKMEELKSQADQLMSDVETGWNNLLEKIKD